MRRPSVLPALILRLRRRARRVTTALTVLALLGGAALTGTAVAAPKAWTPKPSPMTTPWTSQVPTDKPLPEYPRPQLTRSDWANLNGIWDFAVTGKDAGQPTNWTEQIRVPFVAESALSGIQRKITQNDKLWYKRTFTVPADWNGRPPRRWSSGSMRTRAGASTTRPASPTTSSPTTRPGWSTT